MMHKALHTRDDLRILYASRKEGGKRLASFEDSVDASIRRFEDYIKRQKNNSLATRNNA